MQLEILSKQGDKITTELWLIRHGRASHNKYDNLATFAGGRIDSALSTEGIDQTEQLAKELAQQDRNFDLILCSRMKRARQTAEILSQKLQEHLKIEISVKAIDHLEEIDAGDFTGLTEAEARELNPESAEAFYRGEADKWDFPGGENHDQLSERARKFLTQIKSLTKGKRRVIIVGHGMFNRMIFYELFPNQPRLWRERSYPHNLVRVIDWNDLAGAKE